MKRFIIMITTLACCCLTACGLRSESSGNYYNNYKTEGDDCDGKQSDDRLSEKVTVTYTDDDINCRVLTTKVSSDTTVKVQVRMRVSERDRGKSTNYKGFNLSYKTESGEEINAIKYNPDVYASDGYEEIEQFNAEIVLPAGNNELIYSNNGGDNYKVTLDVKVDAAKS